jgi:hypothetical protein
MLEDYAQHNQAVHATSSEQRTSSESPYSFACACCWPTILLPEADVNPLDVNHWHLICFAAARKDISCAHCCCSKANPLFYSIQRITTREPHGRRGSEIMSKLDLINLSCRNRSNKLHRARQKAAQHTMSIINCQEWRRRLKADSSSACKSYCSTLATKKCQASKGIPAPKLLHARRLHPAAHSSRLLPGTAQMLPEPHGAAADPPLHSTR